MQQRGAPELGDRKLPEQGEQIVRFIVKETHIPPQRMLAIAWEMIRDETDAELAWSASLIEGELAKRRIERLSGEFCCVKGAGEMLGVSTDRIRGMINQGDLIAYRAVHGDEWRLPLWQFSTRAGRTDVYPWVRMIIQAYGGNGWGLLDFLCVPRVGGSHLSRLQSAPPEIDAVLAAARRTDRS